MKLEDYNEAVRKIDEQINVVSIVGRSPADIGLIQLDALKLIAELLYDIEAAVYVVGRDVRGTET